MKSIRLTFHELKTLHDILDRGISQDYVIDLMVPGSTKPSGPLRSIESLHRKVIKVYNQR